MLCRRQRRWWRSDSHPTNTSNRFRLSSLHPNACIKRQSCRIRRVSKFLCSFRPRKANKKKPKKKRSVDDQHQPNEFQQTNTTSPNREFSSDRSHTHTTSHYATFNQHWRAIMHIECNCKRKRFSMLPSTTSSSSSHVCGSLLVLSDDRPLDSCSAWCTAHLTTRKIAELKFVIRILCVFYSHGASR